MIKHILKIMWNQRRSNGWIFAELLVVAAVLWMMVDTFWVDYRDLSCSFRLRYRKCMAF